MKNKSIDKMAEQFTSPEELKAYSDAQYKTIQKLNEDIKSLNQKIDALEQENISLKSKVSVSELGQPQIRSEVSNEEVACVTQISIIKNNAMERELTMDETKRLEIYVKTLQLIRGKVPEEKNKKNDASGLSNEDLMSQMEAALKS